MAPETRGMEGVRYAGKLVMSEDLHAGIGGWQAPTEDHSKEHLTGTVYCGSVRACVQSRGFLARIIIFRVTQRGKDTQTADPLLSPQPTLVVAQHGKGM